MTAYNNQIDWYQTFTMEIAAGERRPINKKGRYLTFLSSNVAEAPRLQINGQFGGFLPAGISIELPPTDAFDKIELVNETAAPMTVDIAVSNGKIIDARTVLSGAVEVRNPVGEVLDVNDASIEAKIGELIANNKINVDLTNAVFASATNTINTVVTAIANTNGVIVHNFTWYAYSTFDGVLIVDGNDITPLGNGTTAGIAQGVIENYFVPPGQSVAMRTNNAAITVSMMYEVL